MESTSSAQLLTIVEVLPEDKVLCAQPGCGHSVWKAIHVVRDGAELLVHLAAELRQLEDKVDAEFKALDDKARKLVDTLAATGLPMGWKELDFQRLSFWEQTRKVLGWLLTAFALSLGAPFWFDLLQKLSSIRSVGKNLLERKQANEKTAGS